MRESLTGIAALVAVACCLLVPLALAGGASALVGAVGGQRGLVLAGAAMGAIALAGAWARRRRR